MVIEKTEANALGIGSYGAVYRAKIGQLPCAAKILHPTLFHVGDPGSDRIRTLFERECRVLRRIRHPHVIQYIKSFQDEASQLPILLMELMDESLTHYLESLPTPVPHHIQLNISHDVALALEFLHSIGVLHRDLSGNNVLLIAGKRAKVTDFGMAKILDGNVHMTPATFCPGTMAYMPPEAFHVEPKYTEKLDCFSAGVVYLQILTRKFPNPGDRVRPVFNDARYPTGIEVRIPERERRHDDIVLVSPDNPLLHIALDCIHDEARLRPAATEVCARIEALKSTSWSEYVSEQERLEREGGGGGGRRGRGRLTTGDSSNEGEDEEERGVVAERARELETQLGDTQELLQVYQSQCEIVQAQLSSRESDIEDLRREVAKVRKQHAQTVTNLKASLGEKQEKLEDGRYELERAEQNLSEKGSKISDLERQLCQYRTTDFQYQQDREMLSLPVHRLLMPPTSNIKQRALSASDIPSLPGLSTPPPSPDLQWRSYGTARNIEGYSSAVRDTTAFFTDGTSVIVFNTVTGDWTTLPPCPKHSFAVCIVGGLLTAVGGYSEKEGGYSRSLLSLSGGTGGHGGGGGGGGGRVWQETYPSMRYGRTSPSVVSTASLLVVAGGHGSEESGRSVELLDMSTMIWSTATPLPFSIWRASAVTCGNRLYIAGGVREGRPLGCHDVLYCSLSDLQGLSSNSPSSHTHHKKLLPFRLLLSSHKVWHTTAKLPTLQSTLVALQGRMYAVGGQGSLDNTPVSDVHSYSVSTNVWSQSSHMTQPRSRCFAVVVPGNRVMVLGGSVEPYTMTDSIEMAQF